MKNELKELGLSEQESDIYIELLNNKPLTAGQIAKATRINRSVVYFVLDSLIEKGLVGSVIIDGVKRFSANDIISLKEFVERKEEVLRELLPKLKSINGRDSNKVKIEVFQGINGGLAVMKDLISTGEDYLAFGEDLSFQNVFGTIAEQYIRKLKEKKIKEKLLVPKGQKVLMSDYTEVRYLPKEMKLPTMTAVYGNKVAIAIFQKPYHAIVIQSDDLAESYRSLFKYLWSVAKK